MHLARSEEVGSRKSREDATEVVAAEKFILSYFFAPANIFRCSCSACHYDHETSSPSSAIGRGSPELSTREYYFDRDSLKLSTEEHYLQIISLQLQRPQ